MTYGFFTVSFAGDGTFSLQGTGWPTMAGTWKAAGEEVTISTKGGPPECAQPGRYTFQVEGAHLRLTVAEDLCTPRRMILDRSVAPGGGGAEDRAAQPGSHRPRQGPGAAGRGTRARGAGRRSAERSGRCRRGTNLPDVWDPAKDENVLWRTPIPGLAHSSPIVWGDRVFVTTAISSKGNASFKPGLYGDGDASDDTSTQKWVLYAIDRKTGKIAWERTAFEGAPGNKRHMKSTYASASPATDGRIVVAWFGSQGVHAFDVNGQRLWQVDLGRVNMGAYDIPAYEWGPASSPIIWNDLVFIQCDTQADSFILALDAKTGKTVWKTERDELPSWGTPTVLATKDGPELVTNASKFVRAYDPRTGTELWRLGGSSKITAPTPISAEDLLIVASGRAPERPIFAVRPQARGDVTLARDTTSNAGVAWSKTGRGPYMPTPLVYDGILYVLANNGVFDAYEVATGQEIYRQRLPTVGSGFSASPVAADGKIYLSNEDGEMLVVAAGREFKHIATNSMGDLLMATPALSDGVMYVRTARSLFAIGRR